MTIQRDDVATWLRAYVEAWRSYDADAIGAPFAEYFMQRPQSTGASGDVAAAQ